MASTPPRAGGVSRRECVRSWTHTEVRTLLSLVAGSGKAAQLLFSSRRQEALWQRISKDLAAAGYERGVSQCRAKWMSLKLSFLWMREKRRRADYRTLQLVPYYRVMKIIWKAAGRPIFDPMKVHSRKHRLAFAMLSKLVGRGLRASSSSGFLTHLENKRDEGEASSRGTEAMREQPAGGEASSTHLYGSDVRRTPEDVQPLLLQILQASQQQQALLESLAKNTASQLHLISQNLFQVGETLQHILLRPQIDLNPTGQFMPHLLIFGDGSAVTCFSCAPNTFSDGNGEPQLPS